MDTHTREACDKPDDQDDVDVVGALKQTIAQLQARVAELEQPAPQWTPLKRAASAYNLEYETARKWAERGLIEARREGGRWFVCVNSLKARQARLFARL